MNLDNGFIWSAIHNSSFLGLAIDAGIVRSDLKGSHWGVYDFIKRTSIISYSLGALEKSAPSVQLLAEMEHLDAHANAINLRVKAGSRGQA